MAKIHAMLHPKSKKIAFMRRKDWLTLLFELIYLCFRFETMKVMNQLCQFDKNMSKLFTDQYASESMYATMIKVLPHMSETFQFCKLFDEWINCRDIFFISMSNEGYCFSFNLVRLSEQLTDA